MADGRLVVSEDYQRDEAASGLFRDRGIRAAMAAPVHESGRAVGSLIVASNQPGRRYSSIERDMLLAFADHASLALSDARSIQAMREADAARIQARFRSLVNSSSDMITVIDSAGQIVFASPSVERALVLPESGYEGTPLALLIHPDDRPRVIEFIASVARDQAPGEAGGVAHASRRRHLDRRRDDGDRPARRPGRPGHRAEQPRRDRAQAARGAAAPVAAARERRPARRRHRARLQQLPVGDPRLRALPARRARRGGRRCRSDAVEIEKAAERASRLTSQLLVFSRHEVVQRRVVDVAEVLGGLTSLLARTLGENVSFQTDAERPLWRVVADPTQMEQVLVNLAVNARDAMPSGGELRIELANVADGLDGARRASA